MHSTLTDTASATDAVRRFAQLSRADVGLAGGKGANLGELTRAGLPVPDGFVVCAPAYAAFCDGEGLRSRIEARLAPVDVDDTVALEQAAQEVRQLVEAEPIPGLSGVYCFTDLKLPAGAHLAQVRLRPAERGRYFDGETAFALAAIPLPGQPLQRNSVTVELLPRPGYPFAGATLARGRLVKASDGSAVDGARIFLIRGGVDLGRRGRTDERGEFVVAHRLAWEAQHAMLAQGAQDRAELRVGQRVREVDAGDAGGAVGVAGLDGNLPALPGAGRNAHTLQDDGQQARGHLLARGHDDIVLARIVKRGGLLAPGDELVGLAGHG